MGEQIYWFHSLGDDKGNRFFWGGSEGFIADTSERDYHLRLQRHTLILVMGKPMPIVATFDELGEMIGFEPGKPFKILDLIIEGVPIEVVKIVKTLEEVRSEKETKTSGNHA